MTSIRKTIKTAKRIMHIKKIELQLTNNLTGRVVKLNKSQNARKRKALAEKLKSVIK